MPPRITLEIAVDSLEDALRAERAGADRIELCASLESHGLTPAPSLVRDAKREIPIPIMAMVRARPGSFVISPADLEALSRDAGAVLEAGADGIVFGTLTPTFEIDKAAAAHLAAVAHGRETVFHRAIDLVPDSAAATATIAKLNITRILSAGQSPHHAARAMDVDGPPPRKVEPETDITRHLRLRAMIAAGANRTTIMPGGGVRAANVASLVRATGATEVHSSCRATGTARLDESEVRRLREALDTVSLERPDPGACAEPHRENPP